MQVFKLCLKILKKNIPALSIYVIIFIGVAVIMTFAFVTEQANDYVFTRSKSNLAFLSAENTPLIAGLKAELGKVANFVKLPDEKEALQDALFFRTVSYILRVPTGFSEKFMQGGQVRLEKISVPGSYSSAYLDLSIDQYFNLARLYLLQAENLSQEELVKHVAAALAAGAEVELLAGSAAPDTILSTNLYFNYLAYSLLSVTILGMSTLMLTYHNQDLQKRNACSPLTPASFNRQFGLAVLAFTGMAWLLMVTLCLLFTGKNIYNPSTVFFLINSLAFAVCSACLSFLIGNLVTNVKAIPAISNVVTLGLSFLSGIFVPVELLGSSVLKIAGFTPTYWFVAANNHLAGLKQFNSATLQPVFSAMLLQIAFALAFFAIALVAAKKRRLQ
ncbi:MAG TPA: ABC transporter permease [Firmicutes bacterium]|nr:ABC transporter permease [Bacillota bacterium]